MRALAARVGDGQRLVPGRQQLGFALGGQSDAVLGRRVRGAGDRLRERAEAETGVDCAADVRRVHAGPLRVGEPERQLHPLADLVLLQELVRDPGDVRAGEQLAPRDALVRRVERPGETLLDAVDDPLGQVADVDELSEPIGRARGEDLAAAAEPARPVGEAAGRVVRADDQTRAGRSARARRTRARPPPRRAPSAARSSSSRARARRPAARRARPSGSTRSGRSRSRRRRRRSRRRRSGRRRAAAPPRRARPPGCSRTGRRPRPSCAREQGEVALPVAVQLLDLREEVGVRLAAVEERQLVPAGERSLGGRPAEELRAAEDQEPQWNLWIRAPDGLGAELERVDRDPLVGRVDQLRELEVLRQPHRQEAVGLDADPGEEAAVGDADLEQRHRDPFRVELADHACERLEEAEVGRRRAGVVADELELDVVAGERLQLGDQLVGRRSRAARGRPARARSRSGRR